MRPLSALPAPPLAPPDELVAALDGVDGGVFLLDHAWRVTYVNAEATRLLRRPREATVGRVLWELVPELAGTDSERCFRRAMAGERVDFETFGVRNPVWFAVRAAPHAGGLTLHIRDITARRAAEAERDRFFAMSRDMFGIAGSDGRFRRVNAAFEATLGWTAEELTTHEFFAFVHPDDQRATERELARMSGGAPSVAFRNRYRHKDGTYRWLAWHSTAPDATGAIYATARDVTDEVLLEVQRAENERRLRTQNETLVRLARRLGGGLGLGAALAELAEEAARVLDVSRASVWLLEPDGAMRCADLWDRADGRHTTGLHLPPDAAPAYFAAVDEERVIAAHDALSDPRTREFTASYLAPLGIGAMLDATVRVGGRTVGVLCAEHVGGPRAWAADEQRFAASLGDLVALALEGAERRRAERELLDAKEAAEQANRAKSDFLARMSHELRTPLNSVIGFANILEKNRAGTLRAQDVTYVERIRANGRHLLTVINDILDLAKVEAGKLELSLGPARLDGLVCDAAAQCAPQLRGRAVRLVVDVPDDLAPMETDADRLRQVLLNLLANAMKFTRAGAVTVRVECDPASRRPTAVVVRDTGIGIPRERLAAIFEAFEQADSSTSRDFGGTGLGLAITRSLCLLLGYELSVESEVGVGSTFRVAF